MAHHRSALKRIRTNDRRRIVNRDRVSRVWTYVRKVLEAVATGDQATAQAALRQAQPELHRAAGKGVMHKNTVARTLSRLSKQVKAIAS